MNENKNTNNTKHKELSFDEENDEDEEHCTMAKDNKSSTVASNDKKHKRKVTKCYVDESDHNESCEVVEHEGDFKQESKAVESVNVLVKNLKQEIEKGCVKCEKLQKNSTCIEVMHETLVSELKDEMCRVMYNSKEENYLEVDDMQKQIEENFEMEDTEEFYEGRDKFIQVKEIVEEMKKKARDSEEDAELKVELEREE